MALVTLVSGGIDSTLMAVLVREEGIRQHPLFVDYGQLCMAREWMACRALHKRLRLPAPVLMNLHGFGQLISCGLTNTRARINEDGFLPGRNLLFLVAGAGYACQVKARGVAIGLLSEKNRIFPDQTAFFLKKSQSLLEVALGRRIELVAPLMRLSKRETLELARIHKISGTYSCHAGGAERCGVCISCVEIENAK